MYIVITKLKTFDVLTIFIKISPKFNNSNSLNINNTIPSVVRRLNFSFAVGWPLIS